MRYRKLIALCLGMIFFFCIIPFSSKTNISTASQPLALGRNVVAYINGLNTEYQPALEQSRSLRLLAYEVRSQRLVGANIGPFINSYELYYNQSTEDLGLGERGQFIASIPLKIIEANPSISMDQAWQLTRR